MSWQAYVDDQLIATQMVKDAVICGHDGAIWAKSKDFEPTPAELKTLSTNIGSTDVMAANGVTIAGVRYMFLSGTDRIVRAKKGEAGLHVMKTGMAVILCRYEKPTVPEQCATVTEKLGDYLISVNY